MQETIESNKIKENKKLEVLQILFKNGADIKKFGPKLLERAARDGLLSVFNLLLEKMDNPNIEESLHTAIVWEQDKIVASILEGKNTNWYQVLCVWDRFYNKVMKKYLMNSIEALPLPKKNDLLAQTLLNAQGKDSEGTKFFNTLVKKWKPKEINIVNQTLVNRKFDVLPMQIRFSYCNMPNTIFGKSRKIKGKIIIEHSIICADILDNKRFLTQGRHHKTHKEHDIQLVTGYLKSYRYNVHLIALIVTFWKAYTCTCKR